MAWITTPPHTRKVIDDRDRLPFDQPAGPAPTPSVEASAAEHGALVANPASAQPAPGPVPPAEPMKPRDSQRYRAPSGMGGTGGTGKGATAGKGGTTRVLRTLGGNGDPIKADGPELTDLSVFRRYPALFHRVASHKRGLLAGLRLSLYDMVLIFALGGLLVYLLVMALTPAPDNNGLPTTPPDPITFPAE